MPVDVKICGLNDAVAVAAAVKGGARFIGFVFFPASPRAVTPAQASLLAGRVPPGITRVGLVVDADDAALDPVVNTGAIDVLQLHGRESAERVAKVRERFGLPVMKGVAIAGPDDVARARAHAEAADMLLFDAKAPADATRPGGNALAFDWKLIAGEDWPVPWFLAGGLTVDNLGEAVATSGARRVDVSSGVEAAPGRKDPARIAAFLEAARAL